MAFINLVSQFILLILFQSLCYINWSQKKKKQAEVIETLKVALVIVLKYQPDNYNTILKFKTMWWLFETLVYL